MTDTPVLLPNVKYQAPAKTGLASLPPRPAHIASPPPKPGADSYGLPPTVGSSNPWSALKLSTHPIAPDTNVIQKGRETGSVAGNLPQIPSPTVQSSSSSSRASIDTVLATSSIQAVTPSSPSLGKRSFDRVAGSPKSVPSTVDTTSSTEPRIIPILPTPLPSKRFKKGSQARASLVPVEQLPVFPLPPLPVISDPVLEKQVFTHQSCFPRRKWRFEDPEEDPSLDYEKLEHVGDSILGMVVTTWLHELKPRLTCGRASVS
jgi:hypothetical protein